MVKIISCLKRRPDITHEEFVQHWNQAHGPVVRENLPGLRRYIQNPTISVRSRTWEWDGVAELWFDDVDAVKAAFKSPGWQRILADEEHFIADQTWVLVTEVPVLEG
jgi:uncharacterized protein (TIGR02118 family)